MDENIFPRPQISIGFFSSQYSKYFVVNIDILLAPEVTILNNPSYFSVFFLSLLSVISVISINEPTIIFFLKRKKICIGPSQ